MGTPEFAVPILQKLHLDGYAISAVYSQPDRPQGRKHSLEATPVKAAALNLGLNVLQPSSLKDPAVAEHIKELAPDFIIVAAYGNMLSRSILDIPTYGCINVHASLLPDLRGASPIQFALLQGYNVTGVSIMQMEEGLDSGPVFIKRECPIEDVDNLKTLTNKLSLCGADALSEILPSITAGSANPRPQDESQATFAPKMKRSDEMIDWLKDATTIRNQIRALAPATGATASINNRQIKIYDGLRVVDPSVNGTPGEIVKISKEGIFVLCQSNILQITELQAAGKKKLKVADFYQGAHFQVGDCFSSDPEQAE